LKPQTETITEIISEQLQRKCYKFVATKIIVDDDRCGFQSRGATIGAGGRGLALPPFF